MTMALFQDVRLQHPSKAVMGEYATVVYDRRGRRIERERESLNVIVFCKDRMGSQLHMQQVKGPHKSLPAVILQERDLWEHY